jgi:DNA alkylation damage repair protein AlkB
LTRKAGIHENASINKWTVERTPPIVGHSRMLHPSYLDRVGQERLLAAVHDIIRQAPLYPPRMPRSGSPFSVRMTNCGPLGWVSDVNGYRYQAAHPVTGRPWPAIPDLLLKAWSDLADYPHPPEACLINYYGPTAKMGLHQDRDEQEFAAPVVSSLATPACFATAANSAADQHARSGLHRATQWCSPKRTASLFMGWIGSFRERPPCCPKVAAST